MSIQSDVAELQGLVQIAISLAQQAIDATEETDWEKLNLDTIEDVFDLHWSGEVFYLGKRFYDSSIAGGDTTGTAIADNSSDAKKKKFIKVDFSSNTVSYESGPIPYVSGIMPEDEEWYETVKHTDPIHVSGR